MTISIPQNLFDLYNSAMDTFLENDNFSRLCTIVYPSTRIPCGQCNVGSPNVYSHGGPALFGNENCTECGGRGYKESEVTDSIRLRIYWNKKNWILGGAGVIGSASVQVIGYISDLPKLIRADSVILVSENHESETTYRISGEPFYHGFGKNRYFVTYLERA